MLNKNVKYGVYELLEIWEGHSLYVLKGELKISFEKLCLLSSYVLNISTLSKRWYIAQNTA